VKAINNDFLIGDTVIHPYDSNPGYSAKINTFYYSEDEKFIAGYWEAPEGWFDAEIEEQSEINYVIEGEIDIICGDKKITAKKGDCFLVESGESLRWVVKKPVKTIFFIYPAGKELVDFFKALEYSG
jgi:ethanolamine utilization protein EutQ (cupin superfamily)